MTASRPAVEGRDGPLSPEEAAAVRDLADTVAAADGVEALSEQFRLALTAAPRTGDRPVRHLRVADGPTLHGYAQLDPGPGPSAEALVAPDRRRRGTGTALLLALRDADPAVRVWAHGDLPAARALASSLGMTPTRTLHVMTLDLGSATLPPAALPDGLVARPFRPGADDAAWLALNTAAFASHPEQGRMTRADLAARMAEPWFDPAGLILVVRADRPDTVVASHWTKVAEPDVGEVYVVAVHPDAQGRGLGVPVTLLGLHHLRTRGVPTAVLYVDGDNARALATYRRLGFAVTATHRMYGWA